MLDVKISGAAVVDGTGGEPFEAEVGINGGEIVQVGGDLPSAGMTIEAPGCIITPGFIDTHSHSDLRLLQSPPPLAKLSQGITTELLGQDGLGTAPVNSETLPQLARLTAGLLGSWPAEKWTWRSFADYLAALQEADLPNHQACLISHGPVRLEAMGNADRKPDDEEMDRMRNLVAEAMQQGAWGFSTGLIYPPGSFADTEELAALAEETARHDGIFVVHLRDEGYHLLDALEEAIEVCRRSGCHLHISHLQAYGEVNWPNLPRALQRITRARQGEITVTCDRYPYLAGSTVLSAVLPAWVLDGGPDAALARLADDEHRRAIHRAFDKGLQVWHNRAISVGWENIVVSWVQSEDNSSFIGMSMEEISRETQKDPVDAVCDLLLAEQLQVTMISHYGSEENLSSIYRHPASVVATDGIYGGRPHPRLWGSYPRFFSRYVAEEGTLTLPEAVRKTTSAPARILGLTDRGTIKAGQRADLVVFDLDEVADRATYQNPEMPSVGIKKVMVKGSVAYDGDSPEKLQAAEGQVLKNT